MSSNPAPFLVKLVRTANGERLPMLLNRATGLPDFDAALWVVTSLRSKNSASETITQALRSVLVLYTALQGCKVNLSERLGTGNLLSPGEIEEIARACRHTVRSLVKSSSATEEVVGRKLSRICSLEKLRMSQKGRTDELVVAPQTAAIRLGYIREFLNWRVSLAAAHCKREAKLELLALRGLVDEALHNKTPAVTARARIEMRTGLSQILQDEVIRTVTPTSTQNPWCGRHVRLRNQLIIQSILGLGIRRGELLGLRVGDFRPHVQEVLILRRPDDVNDPRTDEPNAKTRDRILPVTYQLHSLLKKYLVLRSGLVRGKHDFLFIANSGAPLSKSALNTIFYSLSRTVSVALTPHILRHTFFENLADQLHRSGQDDMEMQSILTRLGGWGDTSDSPRRYTKRFAQERAFEAGLALQAKLYLHPLGQL